MPTGIFIYLSTGSYLGNKYGPHIERQFTSQPNLENVLEHTSNQQTDLEPFQARKYTSQVETRQYNSQINLETTRDHHKNNFDHFRKAPNIENDLETPYAQMKYGPRSKYSREALETDVKVVDKDGYIANQAKYGPQVELRRKSPVGEQTSYRGPQTVVSRKVVLSSESFSRKERSRPVSHLEQSLEYAEVNSSRRLIAHSARVQTPQRHHSESVLYIGEDRPDWKEQERWNNDHNKLKLFPVSTYTVQPDGENQNHRYVL